MFLAAEEYCVPLCHYCEDTIPQNPATIGEVQRLDEMVGQIASDVDVTAAGNVGGLPSSAIDSSCLVRESNT